MMVANPMEDIKQPLLTPRVADLKTTEMEELRALMVNNKRDLLIFYLHYYEGLKTSEIIKIKKDQYHQEQKILYLKQKAVHLHAETSELFDRISASLESDAFYFCNQHQKPLTLSGMYFLIKKYLYQIGRSDIRPIDLIKQRKA
jgi:site-specific recombinase XerD